MVDALYSERFVDMSRGKYFYSAPGSGT